MPVTRSVIWIYNLNSFILKLSQNQVVQKEVTLYFSWPMKASSEYLKAELKKLGNQGVSLYNAMQVEQYPDRMQSHFTNVLKKDYPSFVKTLPSFNHTYQSWYSAAQAVIRRFMPARLNDFISLYESPKGRKEIRSDNYVIEDYLREVTITTGFDKKVVASPPDAIPVFQQQLNILNAVVENFDSALFDISRLLQSEFLDAELQSARELAKNHFLRSAGAICGITLIKHFEQLRESHQLKMNKKNAVIKDYNDLFKAQEVFSFEEWRFVQYLSDLWLLCCRNKKEMPSAEQVNDFIDGTEKVIKTLF